MNDKENRNVNPADLAEFINLISEEVRVIKGTTHVFEPGRGDLKTLWNKVEADQNKSIQFDSSAWLPDALLGYKAIIRHNLNSSNTVVCVESVGGLSEEVRRKTIDANSIAIYSAKKFSGRCIVNTGFFNITNKSSRVVESSNINGVQVEELKTKVDEIENNVISRMVENETEINELLNASTLPMENVLYSLSDFTQSTTDDEKYQYTFKKLLTGNQIFLSLNDYSKQIVESRVNVIDNELIIKLTTHRIVDPISIDVNMISPSNMVNALDKVIGVDNVAENELKRFITPQDINMIDKINISTTSNGEKLKRLESDIYTVHEEFKTALMQLGVRNGKMTSDALLNGIFTKVLSLKEYNKFLEVVNSLEMCKGKYTSVNDRLDVYDAVVEKCKDDNVLLARLSKEIDDYNSMKVHMLSPDEAVSTRAIIREYETGLSDMTILKSKINEITGKLVNVESITNNNSSTIKTSNSEIKATLDNIVVNKVNTEEFTNAMSAVEKKIVELEPLVERRVSQFVDSKIDEIEPTISALSVEVANISNNLENLVMPTGSNEPLIKSFLINKEIMTKDEMLFTFTLAHNLNDTNATIIDIVDINGASVFYSKEYVTNEFNIDPDKIKISFLKNEDVTVKIIGGVR